MVSKRFLPSQTAILKEKMKFHAVEGKFTSSERAAICDVTNLSRQQVRMWERNFSRMSCAQRKRFLAKPEKQETPKGFARRISGTFFNGTQTVYERFLMFKGVPDNARIRNVSYIEAIINNDTTESTFFICFKTQVWLGVVGEYLAKLGAGSMQLVPFAVGNGSTTGASNALHFIHEKKETGDSSEYTHFKHGRLSKTIASRLQRKQAKQEVEER